MNCRKGKYKGETASNGYTRGGEHLQDFCVEQHGGVMQEFEMSITGSYRNDAMLRQITEAVQINNTNTDVLMNDRAEWNMTRIPRTVISAG